MPGINGVWSAEVAGAPEVAGSLEGDVLDMAP
jgi:hypothetical protein